MKMPFNHSFLAFVLALAAASGPSIAAAGPTESSSLRPTVKVRFAGLDVSSSAGAQILYNRIKDAAETVCRNGTDWYPTVHWAQQDCLRATVNHAVAELNIPEITAMHLAETQPAKFAPPLQASNR